MASIADASHRRSSWLDAIDRASNRVQLGGTHSRTRLDPNGRRNGFRGPTLVTVGPRCVERQILERRSTGRRGSGKYSGRAQEPRVYSWIAQRAIACNCLLYTSDAADDLLCVDLG